MNIKEYERLIENTIIPGNLKEQSSSLKATCDYINSLLPKKLYRFRRCSELNFDAFDKDQMWFSSGSEMNDDFDARLSYDVESIRTWLHSFIAPDGGLIPIELVQQLGTLPNEIHSFFPQENQANEVIKWFRALSKDEVISYSNSVVQYIESDLDNGLKIIESRVQNLTKYACLSENINSDMMWGIYSENATGFALEYQFNICNIQIMDTYGNCQSGNLSLFPILYKNQRLDATEYAKNLYQVDLLTRLANQTGTILPSTLINEVAPCPDIFMLIKLAIYKSEDWKPENEWRLFYLNNNVGDPNIKHLPVTLRPSGVYLGRKMKDINRKFILSIAKEKNIPVYQMDFSKDPGTYRLTYKRV